MSNLTWNDIPAPPAPTGINQFPPDPSIVQVAQTNLPLQSIKIPDPKESGTEDYIMENILYDQVLTVTAQWKKVVAATASPSTPFHQTNSVTTGTSTTETITKSFSASLGVKASLVSIGASMSQTFSQSITMSESQTISQEFSVTPKEGEISAIWWQLVYTFTITGKSKTLMGGKEIFKNSFTNTMTNADETFVSTFFPSQAKVETSGFEKFMKVGDAQNSEMLN